MTRVAGIALLGLGLAVAAGALDVEPLWVPGLGLLAVAGACEAWLRLAARGAAVRRALAANRVLEEEPLEVVLDVVLGTSVPRPSGVIREPLVPAGLPLRTGRTRLRVSFARRGRRSVGAPALELRDPLGLSRRDVGGGGGRSEVLVLPRLYPVEAVGGHAGANAAEGRQSAAGLVAVEVEGLRQYRPGTPASRIYWPALARGAGLLERRLQPEADGRPLVVLDTRAPASEASLDAAVRAAGSLAHALARAGGCAVLLPDDRRVRALDRDLAGWPAIHGRLALVTAGHAARLPPVARARPGGLVYVAARSSARIPPALAGTARGPQVLVVPGALPGRPAAFAVAGCSGYRLGLERPARAA
jgi:uncharacterized protein (DUF58 family)